MWDIKIQYETTLSVLHVVFANIISLFNKTSSKTDHHVPKNRLRGQRNCSHHDKKVLLFTPVSMMCHALNVLSFSVNLMMKDMCFCVFIWQAKLNEQREHAKQVATFNLQMSEKKEKTYCPLFPVSRTWALKL